RLALDDFREELALLRQSQGLQRLRKVPAGTRRRAELLDLVEQRADRLRRRAHLRPVVKDRVVVAAVRLYSCDQVLHTDTHVVLLFLCACLVSIRYLVGLRRSASIPRGAGRRRTRATSRSP